jgi:hypothetical protein
MMLSCLFLNQLNKNRGSQDRIVSIVSMGWIGQGSDPAGACGFSLFWNVQTSSGAYQSSYSVYTEAFLLGI